MTSANLVDLIKSIQNPMSKLKLIKNKKIYHSDKYIYLDPKEFSIVWHNVLLFIFLHSFYFLGLYGILTFDTDFAKCAPVCKSIEV